MGLFGIGKKKEFTEEGLEVPPPPSIKEELPSPEEVQQ